MVTEAIVRNSIAPVDTLNGSNFDFWIFELELTDKAHNALKIDSMQFVFNCQGTGSGGSRPPIIILCDSAKRFLSALTGSRCIFE